RCRVTEVEIDFAAYDVIHDDVLARRTKSQRALVLEDVTGVLEFFQVALVKRCAFALQIGSVIAADMRTFVPVEAQPFQPFVNRRHCFLSVSFAVSVFDAQDEFPAVMPRKQPVEKRSSRTADVEIPSRRGGETNADVRSHRPQITRAFAEGYGDAG